MHNAISWGARGAVLASVLAAGVVATTPAAAYRCVPRSAEHNVAHAEAVFVGTTSRSIDDNVFSVRVTAVYKGAPDLRVIVDGGNWRMYDGYDLDAGQQYVFYAHFDSADDRWHARACSGTASASDRALVVAEGELGPANPPRADFDDRGGTPGDAADPTPVAATDDQATDDQATDDGAAWPWLGGGAAVAALVGVGLLVRRRSTS